MELDNREEEIHERVTLLLPWYLHRSLTEAEREQVEHHLRACAACHRELEELRQLYSLAQEARTGQLGPSPDLFQRVMARIEVHSEVTRGDTSYKRGEKRTAWSDRVGTWLHSLFAAPWVPTFATVLILVQCVIIASLLGAFYMREPEQYIVITRAESEQPKARGTQPAAYWVRIRIAFVKDGREWQIRNFLQEKEARIVDGPSAEGFYIVEFPLPAAEATAIEELLHTLQKTELVRSAYLVNPE